MRPAFLEHVKRRKQLLEEAAKSSAGLVDGSGKPVVASKLVDGNGKPVVSKLVDASGKPVTSKRVDESGKPVSNLVDVNGEPIEKLHITEDIDRAEGRSKHAMRSASAAMENVYDAKEGDTIEVCPEASMLMQDIIMWLEETKGGTEGKE